MICLNDIFCATITPIGAIVFTDRRDDSYNMDRLTASDNVYKQVKKYLKRNDVYKNYYIRKKGTNSCLSVTYIRKDIFDENKYYFDIPNRFVKGPSEHFLMYRGVLLMKAMNGDFKSELLNFNISEDIINNIILRQELEEQ